MTTILAGMAPTRPPGRAIPIAGARKRSTFVTEPLASSHRAILKRRTKIILILMSQIRDLLCEMVTEPLFWGLQQSVEAQHAIGGPSWERARVSDGSRLLIALGPGLLMPWLQQTNLWRNLTSPRTSVERLRDVRPNAMQSGRAELRRLDPLC
jgi:hypothetical protein